VLIAKGFSMILELSWLQYINIADRTCRIQTDRVHKLNEM